MADSLRVGRYTLALGGHVLEYPGAGPGRRFHQDHLAADSTSYARLRAAGKWYEGNCSQYYTDWRLQQYDPQAVRTITRGDSAGYFAFSVHNATQREFWCIPKYSVSSGGLESPTVSASAQFQTARELCSHGHVAEFLVRQSYPSSEYGPSTMTRDRDRMYGFAFFCMVAGPTAYGGWMPVDGPSPAESTQWWPAVGYDIGAPQNDSVYTFQTGTDARGESYVVYARYFTRGLVLVKPKPNWNSDISESGSPVTTVGLPASLRRLNPDGSLGSAITQLGLKNVEGAVLIGAVTAPGGADKDPPASTTNLAYTFTALSLSPPSLGVAASRATIKVDFNDIIDRSSINSGTVLATGSVSGAHVGSLSPVGRFLTFTPAAPFLPGETVTVRLSSSFMSGTGHRLDGDGDGTGGGDRIWTFTVAAH